MSSQLSGYACTIPISYPRHRKPEGLPSFGQHAFRDKPIQEWAELDGFGPYKAVHHYMPNNITQRDVQRRRILRLHAEERLRVNCIRKADVLPSGK